MALKIKALLEGFFLLFNYGKIVSRIILLESREEYD